MIYTKDMQIVDPPEGAEGTPQKGAAPPPQYMQKPVTNPDRVGRTPPGGFLTSHIDDEEAERSGVTGSLLEWIEEQQGVEGEE